jgi:hypothetical protein
VSGEAEPSLGCELFEVELLAAGSVEVGAPRVPLDVVANPVLDVVARVVLGGAWSKRIDVKVLVAVGNTVMAGRFVVGDVAVVVSFPAVTAAARAIVM